MAETTAHDKSGEKLTPNPPVQMKVWHRSVIDYTTRHEGDPFICPTCADRIGTPKRYEDESRVN